MHFNCIDLIYISYTGKQICPTMNINKSTDVHLMFFLIWHKVQVLGYVKGEKLYKLHVFIRVLVN